jgi:hypothetical protein
MIRVRQRARASGVRVSVIGKRHVLIGVVASVLCVSAAAVGIAHKAKPVKDQSALRCPLVEGRGGTIDTAKTDALMKASRCWLNI